jgi:DNA-binding PadR family transcriptional regulator
MATQFDPPHSVHELTDNEGAFIALVLRHQPVTAYQLAKRYEACPIYTLNTSKGKLYPLLHRLVEHGMLSVTAVQDDRRGTQHYRCTDLGRQALRGWVKLFRTEDELPPDPLRRKLQALELLSHEEQLAWVDDATRRITVKLKAVDAYDARVEGPFGLSAQQSAREELRGRLAWLERLSIELGRPDG